MMAVRGIATAAAASGSVMRILFASTRSAGHFNPLVPFAHACVRAGHDVLVSAPRSCELHVKRAGLAFVPHGEAPREAVAAIRERARRRSLAEQNRIAMVDLFAGAHARAALPGMLATARQWRPDVILRETCEFASIAVAEELGIAQRHVAIHLAAGAQRDWGDLGAALRRLGAGGADPFRDPYLTLAPASLEAAPAPPGTLRFRVPAPDLMRVRGQVALVYVSFGSIAPGIGFFPDLYRRAIDALAWLPIRLLVTVGNDVDPADLGRVPDNVRVERWVPQARVITGAAAMVGHGGSGSTLQALTAGVPLALVPLFADQPYNARRVAELGAGLTLDPSLDGLADAVRDLLAQPGYAAAARAIADEIAALPLVDDVGGILATQLTGEDERVVAAEMTCLGPFRTVG